MPLLELALRASCGLLPVVPPYRASGALKGLIAPLTKYERYVSRTFHKHAPSSAETETVTTKWRGLAAMAPDLSDAAPRRTFKLTCSNRQRDLRCGWFVCQFIEHVEHGI